MFDLMALLTKSGNRGSDAVGLPTGGLFEPLKACTFFVAQLFKDGIELGLAWFRLGNFGGHICLLRWRQQVAGASTTPTRVRQ